MGLSPFFRLCRGRDESKDQSYVLFGIDRRLLPRLMFPVGEYRKEEIRQIAERLGLYVAAKRDSQEICFVPDQDHARFIRERRGVLDTSARLLRPTARWSAITTASSSSPSASARACDWAFGQPRYVVRIEAASRRVVIGTQAELARSELCAAEANWLMSRAEEKVGSGQRAAGSKIRNPEIRNPKCPIRPPPSALRPLLLALSPLPFVAR